MADNAVDRLAAAVGAVAGHEVELERPKDSGFGDYATNVAMRLAKALGRPPRELAEELAAKIGELPNVERAEVAGPGFINLWVSDAFLVEALDEIGEDYGAGSAAIPERIQVEMVSANPTGPITVASARNGAYGDSVARLLEFAGHAVAREYYVNDAGNQMALFRASVDAARRGDGAPENGYQGAYVAELAKEEGDPVPRMLEQMRESLGRFKIEFDNWQSELALADRVPAAVERLDTYEGEGTLWARTSAHGDSEDRPLRRSSDGSYLYYASDVAYVLDKFERGFDRAIYVLGTDHHGYVARLKAAAAMLGYRPDQVEVLLYQLVHLVRRRTLAELDGQSLEGEAVERLKMSKRKGDTVFLDDFIAEVGVDAARWFLIDRGPDRTIEIDVDLAREKSRKNPVFYVQMAHARVAGVFRNADVGAVVGGLPPGPLEPLERELVKRLADFPAIAAEAAVRRSPQLVPAYSIELADDFHRFYDNHRVVGEPAEAFRLGLARATQRVIARGLDLVGVEAPERMERPPAEDPDSA